MFGYIAPRLENLEPDEQARFRAVYCGVCRALGSRCGQHCRLGLSYDMAFLALLLGSLYEPQERDGRGRCLVHPVEKRDFVESETIGYAADMNVALAYYKCLDDWNDERDVPKRAFAAALAGPYRKVEQRHPRVCVAIERNMQAISEIERAAQGERRKGASDPQPQPADPQPADPQAQPAPQATAWQPAVPAQGADPEAARAQQLRREAGNPDAAANRFGLLLGEVFAWRDDFWADDLRRFGARLGKFVYVMDAVVDFEDDAKTGSYNPLVSLGATPQDMKEDLDMLAASAADAFERLPLERDMHLLRSVLYAGMWQQYYAKEEKRKQKQQKQDQKEKRRG